jgi:hypothetical protein
MNVKAGEKMKYGARDRKETRSQVKKQDKIGEIFSKNTVNMLCLAFI